MKRRQFIQYTGLSLTALAFAGPFFSRRPNAAISANVQVNLSITGGVDEMIDGTPVFVWAFVDESVSPRPDGSRLTFLPGPVIQAFEGDTLRFSVTNTLNEDHAFAITGLKLKLVESGLDRDIVVIAPGQTAQVEAAAMPAGVYLYQDPLNAPVNRALGLHGVLVVHPTTGNSPYSAPTSSVQRLFDDLGASDRFPGKAWDRERQMIWLFHDVDPRWNAIAEAAAHAGHPTTIDPQQFIRGFLPRYFTLNGRSGCDSAHAADTAPHGHLGEPMLIRVVNTGMALQNPHIHSNHVYLLARNGQVQANVLEKDTFSVRPGETVDILLPFKQPPDIPQAAWPPTEEFTLEEFAGALQEPGVMMFPMHAHNELSQTAAGGNYPQGTITDWMIDIRQELGL